MFRLKYKKEKLKFISDLVGIAKSDMYAESIENDSNLKEHVESYVAFGV